MAKKKIIPCPRKEKIIEEIADTMAKFKKGPVDTRTEEEISSDIFDYINEKLDRYCD